MRKFESEDSFYIKGRGRVFIATIPTLDKPEDLNKIVGQEVLINDVAYKVKGLEVWKCGEYGKFTRFGILIDD